MFLSLSMVTIVIQHHCFKCHLRSSALIINLNCQLPEDGIKAKCCGSRAKYT